MDSALAIHRLHFAFTITFHYLFPQLTMGLALLIVVLMTLALTTGQERYRQAARFWARIFAINFVMGVVTGIPMEFPFGTNWARFSRSAGVIGQTLALEDMFAFFLESSFLGLFLFGEKRLGLAVASESNVGIDTNETIAGNVADRHGLNGSNFDLAGMGLGAGPQGGKGGTERKRIARRRRWRRECRTWRRAPVRWSGIGSCPNADYIKDDRGMNERRKSFRTAERPAWPPKPRHRDRC